MNSTDLIQIVGQNMTFIHEMGAVHVPNRKSCKQKVRRKKKVWRCLCGRRLDEATICTRKVVDCFLLDGFWAHFALQPRSMSDDCVSSPRK